MMVIYETTIRLMVSDAVAATLDEEEIEKIKRHVEEHLDQLSGVTFTKKIGLVPGQVTKT